MSLISSAGNGTTFLVSGSSSMAKASLVSGSATFAASASVTGGGVVSYQWQLSVDAGSTWSNISGATSNTLSLSSLTTADNGKRYRLAASSTGSETVYSQAAILTVT
jgi:hypothetical protein